jgi:hypothetical protein
MSMAVQLRLDPAPGRGLLGLWADDGDRAHVAFSGSADVGDPGGTVVWQVHLPTHRASAWRMLDDSHRTLERTRRRLTELPGLVDELLEDGPAREQRAAVAFGADTEGAEQEVGEAVEGLGRLARLGAPTAWVETHLDERLVARSRTTFAGDLTTVVLTAEADGLERHERSLALAGESRITALQTTAATVRTAVAIATRLSMPGGPLLALPLAWRLLRRTAGPPGRAAEG